MDLRNLIGPIEHAIPEPGRSHKAILWGPDNLLAQALGSFLTSADWEVTRVLLDGDAEHLIREVRRVGPEVVFLCQERVEPETVLPLRLINEQPCPKVVSLGLDSNRIQVYSKQNITLRGASDLLFILEHGHSSNCTSDREEEPGDQNP